MTVSFNVSLLLNILVIILLIVVHDNRQAIAANDNAKAEADQIKLLSIMLLATTFTFLIFTLPFNVYFLYVYFYKVGASSSELFYVCAKLSEYTNYSVNILLYCIAMKRFRKTFLDLVEADVHVTDTLLINSMESNVNDISCF